MEEQCYPVLCWQVDAKNIAGLLLGSERQIVETSAARIKKVFQDYIVHCINHDDYYPEPEIANAKIRTTTFDIRLAYRESRGTYPTEAPMHVNIVAIYGNNEEEGYAKCYLPFLEEEFYYYDAAQLNALIEHFTHDKLDGLAPETAHRYLTMMQQCWLEEVRVKNKDNPRIVHVDPLEKAATEQLRGYAEALPYTRMMRKKKKTFPEAAWEQTQLINDLYQKIVEDKANIILVGEPGTGKTVVLIETIRRIHQKTRKDKNSLTFWRTTAQRLIANARYLGEWQEECEKIVAMLSQVNGVLLIQDLMNLVMIGGEGAEDSVAAFLLPMIQQGNLHLIGEVNPQQAEAMRQLLPGFMEYFQIVTLQEMGHKRVNKVMDYFANYCQQNFLITISRPALDLTLCLLNRYVKYERFPGKAVQFLTDCVTDVWQQGEAGQQRTIDKTEIIDRFIKKTGLPEIIIRDELALTQPALYAFFSRRIIAQDTAIRHLSSIIFTYKAGLNDPYKPIATLMFSGPTGVGKTACAKTLAEYFFSSGQKQQPLFRIDMSEFQYPQQISRLIGSDANNPSKLIQHVRERPFSVILLDEIEKADSSVFDILLTVLDEGLFVDAFGRVTDFRNTIIIMTSNLGVTSKQSIGFSQDPNNHYEADIRKFFRPEFFNRIDQVIQFQPLSQATTKQIAIKELQELNQREGIVKRKLTLTFTDALIDYIASVGFSPNYGARPLQRAIEKYVVGALSVVLVDHAGVEEGKVVVGYQEGKVVFSY